MREIRLKKGLEIPLAGEPAQEVAGEKIPKAVALVGPDFVGLKPRLEVGAGDRVKLGQTLFSHKKIPGVRFTSPGAGKVVAVNRGEKRVLLSVVVELDGDDAETFPSFSGKDLLSIDGKRAAEILIDSGQWTALRTRPFGGVADPSRSPRSIFVTATDTNPHAPLTERALEGAEEWFSEGLKVIAALTEGKVYLCTGPGASLPVPPVEKIERVVFDGPHPAGNAGTHIHFLDPVGRGKEAWHIGVQNVVAVGALFTTGRLKVDRVVSLSGPSVINPRLVRTRIGASLEDLLDGELKDGPNRIVSGSVISGRRATGPTAFLGRYSNQVSVLPQSGKRRIFGWLSPGTNLYSVQRIFLSSFFPRKKYGFTTELHGGARAIVPVGSYEKVMPLDVLPTFLLKALAVNDVEEAEKLGCLELVEEDLALCTFVCPSKVDHGANLRSTLAAIEKEG